MSYLKQTKKNNRIQRIWMIEPGSNVTPKLRRNDIEPGLVEKVTAKPFRRMVNMNGNVVQLDLTNGAADVNTGSPYALDRVRQKLERGFVPADQCAVANRMLPKRLRKDGDKPCEGWTDEYGMPKTMKRDVAPCEHTQRIIDDRHAKAKERQEQFRLATETEAAKNARATGHLLEMLREQATKGGGKQRDPTKGTG